MKPLKRVCIFLAFVFVLWTIPISLARSEPITNADFVDLFIRVTKLDDRLPSDSDQLPPEKFYKTQLSLLATTLGVDEFIDKSGSELLTRGEFASVLYKVVAEEPRELTEWEKIRFLIAKGIAIKDANPAEPIPREEVLAALNSPVLAPLEALAYEAPGAGAGSVRSARASLSSDINSATGTQGSSRTDATTDKVGEQDFQGHVPRTAKHDVDGDGLTDNDELNIYGTDPKKADTDGDGLNDGDEVNVYGTDPTDSDTDDDGMPDGWEVTYNLDPKSDDASSDADSDNLTNLAEYNAGTDPTDSDTDDDGLIDGHESLVWMDSNMQTDPLVADSDDDDVLDVEDAFPRDSNRRGSRDSIREEVKNIIERNRLRKDIKEMLAGIDIREMDAIMEQITDAQTGKVLRDRRGCRVRVEQYVLRPTAKKVQLLNVTLRSGGPRAGLHTFDWTTKFNRSLNRLTAAELRDLPWGDYLESEVDEETKRITGGPNYDTRPSYYPTKMTVKLNNPQGDFLREKRKFSTLTKYREDWIQTITYDKIRLDGAWRNFTVETKKSSGSGNPKGFLYNPKGLGNKWNIRARFYVIEDGLGGKVGGMRRKRFDNMFDFLGANIIDEKRLNIGAYNLEIRLSSDKFDKNIDLIYIPWDRQNWDSSHHW